MTGYADRVLMRYAEWLHAHAGVPPTMREFADALGVASAATAWRWIERLVADGHAYHAVPERRTGSVARSNDVVLTPAGWQRVADLCEESVA